MSEPVDKSVGEDAGGLANETDLTPQDIDEAPARAGALLDDLASLEVESRITDLEALVAERTDDLQRLQAQYINYKKRVDRDRLLARQGGIEAVLRDLMPVFDSIVAAQDHGELTGGFKLTADELVKVAKSYGFESFGVVGDEFDPRFHEALMQMPDPDADTMTLYEVMQVGYRINDLVLRPARAVVAVPED